MAWYQANGRDLPWRETRIPYAILVSEVMLQQTQVDRVIPRWHALARALADRRGARRRVARRRDRRVAGARLQPARRQPAPRGARVAEHGWPDDLTELPGVGPYTAAAVGNFAFGRDVLPVDTNVRRVQERTGDAVRRRVRAGALRPRRDDLPRAHPALRRLPARRGVPVARLALRAAAQAVARSRARSGSGARSRCARSRRASSRPTATRSSRSRATGSSCSRTGARRCRRDRRTLRGE